MRRRAAAGKEEGSTLLSNLYDPLVGVFPPAGRLLGVVARFYYRYAARLLGDADVCFLNFGFAEGPYRTQPLALLPADEPFREFIQLYDHLLGRAGLAGQDLLEVSCGRGGGASYAARYLAPRSVVGVDQVGRLVAFCLRQHPVPGLSFRQARAERLPFADRSFDVVLNIEASHCYASVPRFLGEVARVLRPGGGLLFADYRTRAGRARLRAQFEGSGLELLEEEDISPNVLASLRLTSSMRHELIRELAPGPVRGIFRQTSAVEGSRVYRMLEAGELVYLACWLRRP